MYAKRSGVVHWDLADKDVNTKEIERVAREAVVEQMEGQFGIAWGGAVEHHIRQANIIAQKRKPHSTRVA